MKELDQILRLWAAVQAAGESAVLATVIKTQGSSYRLPGARLLLNSRGQRAGSVSGGCLEDEVVKKSWWLTENGPVVRRYDTTPDGEIDTGGFGLGCNGIIHLLLERLHPATPTVLDLIAQVRRRRKPATIAHAFAPHSAVGARLTIDPDGEVNHSFADSELARFAEKQARAALASQADHLVRFDADPNIELFVETVAPQVRLLVFGAGDDAVPITDLANYLGWQVSVFDGRAHYARIEKFPKANQVVIRSADQAVPLETDSWTVAVIMSHSYSQDLATLRELANLPLRYVGILGPRKRTLQLLSDAELDTERLIPALYSPMGLDIGADGPEQVALAVIAEIQAALNGRQGGLLRERSGSIHARSDDARDPEVIWARSTICA